MSQTLVVAGLLLWLGSMLLLSLLRVVARPPLVDRVGPYLPIAPDQRERGAGAFSVESFRDVIGPLSSAVGARVARAFGVSEELAVRLARVHSPLDVTAFRVRQVGWSAGALAGVAVLGLIASPSPALVAFAVVGAPLLTFLVVEQALASESRARQRALFLELPVVAEQLGMLLGAGYSVGAALGRVAERGRGVCGEDLRRARLRVRQGLGQDEALREWAAIAGVPALDRLVSVLALNRQAGDLDRLIAEEARSIRRDVQRELVESIERNAQEVWIPVTVAALLPGVLFLAVPFIEAMRLFTAA